MTTAILSPQTPLTPVPSEVNLRLFTVKEYHTLIDMGIIREDDRCELIDGLIMEKPAINPPHAFAVRMLILRFTMLLQGQYPLNVQLPITLDFGEPEPDFAILVNALDNYEDRHPSGKEVQLAVEISDSTLLHDSGVKLVMYARNKIPVYWIVNLVDKRVEVYTLPRGGKNPIYRTRTDYTLTDTVPVIIAGQTLGSIPVNEFLPQ